MIKASIIVLAYNQLENGTIPCIESIYRNTEVDDFELIVVDNNSSDNTANYLKSIKNNYKNLKIVLNKTNRGYAGGNNDGIKEASGEYIVLLNNDTLVTPNWLSKLTAVFEKDQSIGLVAPVTNNAQDAQCLNFPEISPSNYEDISRDYTEKNSGEWFFTNRLIFFCVVIKRSALEKVGILDENFKRGFFEDDDYCQRAINAGYKLAVAEDAFVYHHCGLSFTNTVKTFEFSELLNTNKKLFIKKHKNYAVQSTRIINFFEKINADLQKYKKNTENIDQNIERILHRMEKFAAQIEETRIAEEFLVKKYQGNLFSGIFRIIKDKIVFLRKLEHHSRNFFKKIKSSK